jgi:hypothetical protein
MLDAHLSHAARSYLEKGHTLQQVYQFLESKGHSKSDITAAIREFFRDEATDYDDKLIALIEQRFREGKDGKPEYLQTIFEDLVKSGHKPFDVEKAMLRAEFAPKMKVRTGFRHWQWYSIVQLIVLTTTVALSLLYHWSFIIPVPFILAGMLAASMGSPKIDPEWRKEFGMIPMVGLWTADGIFGYNSITGNYWRWRVIDPSTYVAGIYLVMVYVAFRFDAASLVFVIICLYLAALSAVSFTMKTPDSSGPPYNLIARD